MEDSLNMFPVYYHLHHREFKEDFAFWETLARWKGEPVLELGCGTGRVMFALAEGGTSVCGLDNSPDMLAYTRSHIPVDLENLVKIYEADMVDFSMAARFPLVILPCNTYSSLDHADRVSTMNCVRRHLTEDGLFAVSMPNPDLLLTLESRAEPEVETTFSHPETGYPVQVSSSWRRRGDVLAFTWYYDHLNPNGQIERFAATVKHNLQSAEAYLDEFRANGYQINALYGDFDTTAFSQDSVYLIILVELKSG